jgi:hypothetical protein
MQQFLVPQFIDVEDKIIGPITTRQFVMVLIGVFITFIEYKIFAFAYFALLGILTLGLTAILAFAKVNGRPIHFFLLNFLQTSKRSTLRVWNRDAYVRLVHEVQSEIKEVPVKKVTKSAVSGSRLRDVALVVNTGGVFEGEELDQFMPGK